MSEDEYSLAYGLPPDWPASLRARFKEGMQLLQQTPVRAGDLADSIGIVGLSEGAAEVWARYIPRAVALEKGERDGFSERQMRVLRTQPPNGQLLVLCIVHRSEGSHQHAMFSVPIRTVIVGVPAPGPKGDDA